MQLQVMIIKKMIVLVFEFRKFSFRFLLLFGFYYINKVPDRSNGVIPAS
jgi:hypothetical protein